MSDIRLDIENCNNIKSGSIFIKENHLNIKYGMNGTGKSTIAQCLKKLSKGESLNGFIPFGSDDSPTMSLSKPFNNVLIFDEEFIQSVVFQESSVINNSFNVFIKSPDYDKKLSSLNDKFKKIKVEIGQKKEVQDMLKVVEEVISKIQLKVDNKSIKTNPLVKSIIEKDNIFNIPKELKKYETFFNNKENRINWLDWKQKGDKFDNICGCPFCAEGLGQEYQEEKKIFTASLKKTNVQNLVKVLEYFESLEEYINEEKYSYIIEIIKNNDDKDTIQDLLTKFISELNLVHSKLTKTIFFDSTKLNSDNIKTLDKYLNELSISYVGFIYLNSQKSIELFDAINESLSDLAKSINDLKKDIGSFNAYIKLVVERSVKDINEFLTQSGIKYELDIETESDSNSIALLKYKSENGNISVNEISNHLSWGEKNAFALILFVYYSLSQESDLIILDDPVSSFDSNKKYAIINRIFLNDKKAKTFYKKNVILFTHDLEPIIDFLLNKKPHNSNIYPTYIRNSYGQLSEDPVIKKDLKSIINFFYEQSKNADLNMVSRIIFLRKYIEHFTSNSRSENVYNILSSLVHGKQVPDKKIDDDNYIKLDEDEIEEGSRYIKKFITSFNYHYILNSYFTLENLLKSYKDEKTKYVKIQLFRVYIEVSENRENIKNSNNVLLKFIDEAFHIENDLVYTLDLSKFDTIPDHIIYSCDGFMSNEYTKNLKKIAKDLGTEKLYEIKI